MRKISIFIPIIFIVLIVLFFFREFVFESKPPIPADTIVGLYHPFRDLYSKEYPNGIPFKNFVITDPVRQQYPWRELAITVEKKLELPLWNPYNFSGTPLLANMQSAALYPLNILFFILPFSLAWSILIILGPLLGGLFLYFYLDNLRLNKWASLLGAISFSFSGFFVAWMEWGTILHVGLWLPLILLSIDKIFFHLQLSENSKVKTQKSKLQLKTQRFKAVWSIIFLSCLVASFFAGHLQTFFYLFILSLLYLGVRWLQFGRSKKVLFLFLILHSLFIIFTSIQWLLTLQFISESARSVDQLDWRKEGWFIPMSHLIQFIAPDFFGNPTTLNYWGVWNYGEFIGYVGMLPLLMAILALFFRHDKKTLLFGTLFFLSLVFSLPTIFAKIPFIFNVPLLSTSQPTRLLFITDFSLAVLAGFGLDYLIKSTHKRAILYPIGFLSIVLFALWGFAFMGTSIAQTIPLENLAVAKRNLMLPTAIFIISSIVIGAKIFFSKISKATLIIHISIAIIVAVDLLRFGLKFTPFTNGEYLFPQTRTIEFLQKNLGNARIMATDSRILPPNFSVIYRLQSVDGYDPLYLQRYGELIAASERGEPNISPPFGFNRIITPHNYESKIIDLLGVKYVLSLTDLDSPRLKKVFQEGKTRVYENKNALPRIFFVEQVIVVNDKKETIEKMFEDSFDLRKTAIVEESAGVNMYTRSICARCNVKITTYSENRVIIKTSTDNDGFLVLTDSFYPTWKAKIDDVETAIYRTDYNFRGINVPKGDHTVEFYVTLL